MSYPALVTFDLWQTLIRSHPDNKRQRAIAVQDIFSLEHSLEEVDKALRDADKLSDAISESFLIDVGLEGRLNTALAGLGVDVSKVSQERVALFEETVANIFSQFPPVLVSHELPELLVDLKQSTGCKMAVISNTGYNTGAQMRTALEGLGILPLFDKLLFSNETGQPKPHPGMFLEAIGDNNPKDCLHIGDNPRADVGGAGAVGMQTALVTKSYTAHDVIVDFARIARRNSKAN